MPEKSLEYAKTIKIIEFSGNCVKITISILSQTHSQNTQNPFKLWQI